VSTATAIAVTIGPTRLAIALVICSVYFAAILASICGHLVVSRSRLRTEQVVSLRHVFVRILLKYAVVYSRCNGSRAERAFNERMTGHGAVRAHLAAACACTMFIGITSHTFAAVKTAICAARFARDAHWLSRFVVFRQLGGMCGRSTISFHVVLMISFVS